MQMHLHRIKEKMLKKICINIFLLYLPVFDTLILLDRGYFGVS